MLGTTTNMTLPHRSSQPLPPERARKLVVDLEHEGLETSRINVVTEPSTSMTETARTDRRTMARPASRVAVGAAGGLVTGLLVGLIVVALGAPAGPTMLAAATAGTLLGGLVGLYRRLPMNTEIVDADAGGDAVIKIDLRGLEPARIAAVDELLERA